ncbi:SCAPER-N domain-containing protein [Aphelenchoides besseyi]|nr:SCAPER-N domain-containing protein [Aphelenchoides besseyi]
MGVQVLNARTNSTNKGTSASSRAFNADQQAMEWNKYVDGLKFSLDHIYEMCYTTHNILACEEALMYVTNAVRDFQSLISSLTIELNWENSENRPQTAIAWELSGAAYSKTAKTESNGIALSYPPPQSRSKRRIKDTNDSSDEEKKMDVYERLAYGKRCNVTRTSTDSIYPDVAKYDQSPKHTGRLMITPRSAMDIPQTKSSMAKIAYSRQLLWQQHKKILTEKLSAKRRQEQSIATIGNRRRSLPVLAKRSSNPPAETNLESINEEDKNDNVEVDKSSTKTHAGHFTTRSDPRGYALEMLDLNNDDEWRALTEEDESLAQEEESLKKEIEEEESISIDEELQRRVILDFGDVDMEADAIKTPWRAVVDDWTISDENEESRVDLVDASSMTDFRFRRPGAAAEVHQRLLSPLRRRNLDVEEMLARQHKAEELRLMLQESKAQRLRELHLRVEEVRKKRENIVERKRAHMEDKMSKATENRQKNLDEIVKKAKDDNSKVLEINFINSIEAENARAEAQLAEQDRIQRLTLLAEERARMARDKASNKAAADERRRLVDQQRADWLREESNKTKERQMLAETQRLEMLESYRQRMKLRGQKVEERRAQEATETKNLQCKIQDKHEKSSKRHDDSVAQVRQKAVECATPKVLQPWVVLSESHLPPSDLKYADDCGKECVACNYTAISDLDLVSHLLSAEHMNERKLVKKQPNVEYMKQELSNSIRRSDKLIATEEMNIDREAMNKSQRSKLKQKLGKIVKLELNYSLSSSVKLSYEKKMQTIVKSLSKPTSEQRGSTTERLLSDFIRRVCAEGMEKRANISILSFNDGFVDMLIETVGNSVNSNLDLSVKRNQKCLLLLLELLKVDRRLCVMFLYSEHLFSLLEWLSIRWQDLDFSIESSNHNDLHVGLCLLLNILTESQKYVEKLPIESSSKFTDFIERLNQIANFLCKSSFLSLNKTFLVNGIERVEIENGRFIRPLALSTNIVVCLTNANCKQKTNKSLLFKLSTNVIQMLIGELYAKIRTDVVSNTEIDSTTLMTSSMVSSGGSSNWPSISNNDLALSALIQIWNALNLSSQSDKQIEECLFGESGMKDALRFVYILISAIRSINWSNSSHSTEEMYSIQTANFKSLLTAICNFASISSTCKILCTVGGQRSLVVQLSQLPFDCLQDEITRPLIMTALVAILFEHTEGVDLVRNHVSPSWMSSFLESYVNDRVSNDERAFLNRVLPQTNWSKALTFFSELQ